MKSGRLQLAIFAIIAAAIQLGCDAKISFEQFSGPQSPIGVTWLFAGGLRDELFPNSNKAFEACMSDVEACQESGGIKLQTTPTGRRALSYYKVMAGLLAAPPNDPNF